MYIRGFKHEMGLDKKVVKSTFRKDKLGSQRFEDDRKGD